MTKIINNLRNIHRSFWFYVLAAIQGIGLIVYYFASKNLEKPAGIKEAFKFLFNNADQYFISIFIGIISIIIFVIILMSIISDFSIIEIFTDEYDGSCYDEIEIRQKLINAIICICLFILNVIFLKYLLSLISAIFIISVVFLAVIWGSNN